MRFAVVALLVACAGTTPPTLVPGPPPLDVPLALVPSGAELVVEADVAQLRAWPPLARVRAQIPDDAAAILDVPGVDLLADVDRFAVAGWALGTDSAELAMLPRGRLAAGRMRRIFAPLGEEDYRGRRVLAGASSAIALVDDGVAAFATRATVRRVLDVRAGVDHGIVGELLAALQHAPAAKSGRAAVRGAMLVAAPVRARLALAGVATESAAAIDWVAAALAVGDGVDLGVVVGVRDAEAANRLDKAARLALDRLKTQRTVRALGLAPFVDDVRLAHRGAEVHFAWRVAGKRLDELIARVTEARARAALGAPTP